MTWRDKYRATLTEIDSVKLLRLINDTEAAMTLRTESLPKVSDHEREEIGDASRVLTILRADVQAESK